MRFFNSPLVRVSKLRRGSAMISRTGHLGIDRTERVLKDHLDLAAELFPILGGKGLQVAASISYRAAVRPFEAEDDAPQGTFSRTAAADQADATPFRDGQGNLGHGRYQFSLCRTSRHGDRTCRRLRVPADSCSPLPGQLPVEAEVGGQQVTGVGLARPAKIRAPDRFR
jgi:hypothetical protein